MQSLIILTIVFITLYCIALIVYIIYNIQWYFFYLLKIRKIDARGDIQPPLVLKTESNIISSILNNSSYVFAIVSVFLIIMYIIWLIIILFIPEWLYPLPIPIRKILLEIQPLPDLDEAGFFRLFDTIVNIFTTREKLLKKIGITGEAIGNFLTDATEYVIKNEYPEYDKENIKKYLNKYKIDNFERSNINTNCNNIVKDELLSTEESLINEELEYCINKDYIQITPDLTQYEKMIAYIDNLKIALKCNLETVGNKIKATNNI